MKHDLSRHAESRILWTSHQCGFTLIELLIVLVVVVLLMTVGVPSFNSFILGQKAKTTAYDIAYTLTYARSEALKRNGAVVLTQAAGGWINGWSLTAGAGTITLDTHEAVTGLTISSNPNPLSSITYNSNGRPSTNATFTISSATSGVKTRCVTISLSGLPSSYDSTSGSCP